MARNLFDMENPFWTWIGKIPEMAGLSLLWILLSLPVLTMPAATSALYDAVARALRPDLKGVFKRFFSTFVKELKRSVLLGLVWGALIVILFFGHQVLLQAAQTDQTMAAFALVYQITALLPLSVFIWLNAMESRFYFGFWALHKTAAMCTISFLPKTALIVIILAAGVVACIFVPMLFLIMPALVAILQSIPIEKAFQRLMPEDAQEAQEA